MGLDMYLNRKTYVQNWSFMKPEELHTITVTKDGKPVDYIDPTRIAYIEEQVGYWRKANAIHKWFVDNCQDGVDDCRNAYVSTEQLEELLDLVTKVLDSLKLAPGKVSNGYTYDKDGRHDILEDGQVVVNHEIAAKHLPTASGFFFGGTDYDEYYIQDLEHTKEILTKVLEEPNKGEFYYHSSW